jgi:catechol 2,3-dioxygenase-like lactoylglutathione lyase family enzyme
MITTMNHITLAVTDIERSFAFYHNILGLTPLVKWDKGAYFLVGGKENGFWFCLNVDAKHVPTDGYTHYAFGVDQKDFEQLAAKIIRSGAKIFKDNTSPGISLYFLDPDGHKLEIHVGNWRARIESKQANIGSWKDVEWFIS